jgi:nitrate/TMAO reductase-like tetraheme cytochrome c subunit
MDRLSSRIQRVLQKLASARNTTTRDALARVLDLRSYLTEAVARDALACVRAHLRAYVQRSKRGGTYAAICTALTLTWPSAFAQVPAPDVKTVEQRWERSTHNEFLRRIVPPYLTPQTLPEPQSRGAKLTAQYCVQCHYVAAPAMHHAEKWPAVISRMAPRMHGKGNMGALMKDLMADMQAPTEEELRVMVAYHQKHAKKAIAPSAAPEPATRVGEAFVQACSQCHALPDPRAYRKEQWPAIVRRMDDNMGWMNRVIGSKPNGRSDPREPQYRTDEIIAYLQRHAKN